MSRALDKETVAALKAGDPEAAYRAIAAVLTEPRTAVSTEDAPSACFLSAPAKDRLEIEFFGGSRLPLPSTQPGGNGYVLRDGNAVAIPKLALVQAFFVARKVLQQHRAAPATTGSTADVAPPPAPPPPTDDLLAATAVILLMDPEHLTAANTRKRLLQARVTAHAARNMARGDGNAAVKAALANEFRLVDSFLTSHLHRHTKSPTLWSHRRWLVSVASNVWTALDGDGNGNGNDNDAVFQCITDVVMVAAVRHPRNYYAWEHARGLMQQYDGPLFSNDTTNNNRDGNAADLLVAVRDWCYRHHNDTSGWSFFFFLIVLVLRPRGSASLASSISYVRGILAHVEEMATSLRWTGESVWVFLRTAVAYMGQPHEPGNKSQDRKDDDVYDRFRAAATGLQGHVDAASREHAVLQQAQDWCATYFRASKSQNAETGDRDFVLIS
ncbi:Protein prenyltransferase [Niveomyces insectorum RCEF 264]|uniref:Protein prenyltransferase n=1 Tax=Niveomyces insectorum RCEF 264 TaxID=1081102 RepID=A0A162JB97_9HYPO|nr:Protein prenyltransferase [Niveomyces insectorum RCEF 264]